MIIAFLWHAAIVEEIRRRSQQRAPGHMILDIPREGKGEFSWKTEATARWWWNKSKARQRSVGEAVGTVQKQLGEWWSKDVNLRRRVNYWAVHIFREHNKEADAWAEKWARGIDGRVGV